MNKVILLGNVGSEPEVTHLQSGSVVAKITLATNKYYKDKNGQKQTETQWHTLEVWGKQAETVEMWVQKGNKIIVEGEIKYETYEKDEIKKQFTKIKVDRWQFVESKQSNNNTESQEKVNNEASDDLPF